MGTRERVLDAAIALVGDEGIRALTHARVDERAGLARGSTSNWFRTRVALVGATIHWLAESERADFANGDEPVIQSADQLVDAFTAMVEAESGTFAWRSRARYALFLECAGDPDLLAPLLDQRALYVEWAAQLLADVGARSPNAAVRTLMAALDGLVLHRITIDRDAEIRPVIERTVRACLY